MGREPCANARYLTEPMAANCKAMVEQVIMLLHNGQRNFHSVARDALALL